MRRLLVLPACLALFVGLALEASASMPPIPTCFPGAGPWQETDHFTELAFVATAIPGCPGLTEDVAIDQVGNGVQHINVNGVRDFWFTTTVVGAATVVQGTAVFNPVTGNLISLHSRPQSAQLQWPASAVVWLGGQPQQLLELGHDKLPGHQQYWIEFHATRQHSPEYHRFIPNGAQCAQRALRLKLQLASACDAHRGAAPFNLGEGTMGVNPGSSFPGACIFI